METAKLENLLYSTAILTFENLGFLLPDEDVSEAQSAAELAATARVRFSGDGRGCLTLRLYGSFLSELTMNMLGEEEPAGVSVQMDAFGELANVVCGNLLPALAGSQAVFDLIPPEVELDDCDECPGDRSGGCAVGINDGRIELDLHIESAVPNGSEST